MTKRILFPLITATAIALLPSCGDDDDDGDNGGITTGGRSASGGSTTSSGGGGRTGGTVGTGGTTNTGGGINATGGAQEPVAGAGGESAGGAGTITGGAGGVDAGVDAGAGGVAVGGVGGANGGAGQGGAVDGLGGAGGDDDGAAGSAGAGGAGIELTDAQILHVTAVANQGEIEQGTVAMARAQNAEVDAYAAMMVTEHGAALSNGSMLAQEIGLASNPISVQLQMESANIVVQLQAAPEAEFDELYMASQVAVHQQVLGLLDEELIPQADDAELAEYLDTIRESVAEHLEEAETLLEEVN